MVLADGIGDCQGGQRELGVVAERVGELGRIASSKKVTELGSR